MKISSSNSRNFLFFLLFFLHLFSERYCSICCLFLFSPPDCLMLHSSPLSSFISPSPSFFIIVLVQSFVSTSHILSLALSLPTISFAFISLYPLSSSLLPFTLSPSLLLCLFLSYLFLLLSLLFLLLSFLSQTPSTANEGRNEYEHEHEQKHFATFLKS